MSRACTRTLERRGSCVGHDGRSARVRQWTRPGRRAVMISHWPSVSKHLGDTCMAPSSGGCMAARMGRTARPLPAARRCQTVPEMRAWALLAGGRCAGSIPTSERASAHPARLLEKGRPQTETSVGWRTDLCAFRASRVSTSQGDWREGVRAKGACGEPSWARLAIGSLTPHPYHMGRPTQVQRDAPSLVACESGCENSPQAQRPLPAGHVSSPSLRPDLTSCYFSSLAPRLHRLPRVLVPEHSEKERKHRHALSYTHLYPRTYASTATGSKLGSACVFAAARSRPLQQTRCLLAYGGEVWAAVALAQPPATAS